MRPLTHVQPVQELSDILVPHSARLLDVRRALRHVLERVAGDLELVFDVLRRFYVHALLHDYAADDLLAEEIPMPKTSVNANLPHFLTCAWVCV